MLSCIILNFHFMNCLQISVDMYKNMQSKKLLSNQHPFKGNMLGHGVCSHQRLNLHIKALLSFLLLS